MPATSQQAVVVDLTNVPGASRTSVEPGTSRTWALDKGAGHCRFAGTEFKLKQGGRQEALPYVVVTRPDDPDSNAAQIDLRIDVVKINPPIRVGRGGAATHRASGPHRILTMTMHAPHRSQR
ncbi:MAG: hypothetical protein ACKOA9_09040 [Actinomycetota bacterium]